jgi:hypothetical protein
MQKENILSRAIYVGNVARDRRKFKNWFIGSFLPSDNIRHSKDVEVKWSFHKTPFEQVSYKSNKTATTVCVVLGGACSFKFIGSGKEMTKNLCDGEYIIWKPRIPHKLIIATAAELFVVRWPSLLDDQVVLPT